MPTLQENHFALITDANDPEHRGRLKVQSQSLVGASYELPDWIEPIGGLLTSNGNCGALFLPEPGSTVELVVDIHDTDYDDMPGERFLQNPNIKWRPATATDSTGPMPLPADLLKDYPNTRGWVTKAGHKLLFNDKGTILVASKDGSTIEMLANGSIVISVPAKLGKAAVDHIIKGTTYRAAEDLVLSSLNALMIALTAYVTTIKTIADPTNAATPPLLAAITNMTAAIATFLSGAPSYLSQQAQVE